ncbi:MAG: hypothetical protein LBD11_05785, partial [Candidatus Peribacteria bacterium]|nr:hypothetical protein [Candidatus Peribacteria bacterium]
MNDDRKFQLRAENMKELFETGIPHGIIAEIMGIHAATVVNDVSRIQKQFGIKIKTPKNPRQLYANLLKVYAQGISSGEKTVLWRASSKILEVEKLQLGMRGTVGLWERLKFPQPDQVSDAFLPYFDLLRTLYGDDFLGIHPKGIDEVLAYYMQGFWEAIAKDKVPNAKSVQSVEDGINLFSTWMSYQTREDLTTLTLDETTLIAAIHTAFEAFLTKREIRLLMMRFGIRAEKK